MALAGDHNGTLIHFPPRHNPHYDHSWQCEAWALEQRMEKFSAEARRMELLALEYDNSGEFDLADSCSTMAENMWREYRRVRGELDELEGGF